MTALQAAERRAEAAERAVTTARIAVNKAAVLDPRMMLMLGTNDARRVAFEKASAVMHAAQARSDQARKAVEQVRKASAPKADPKAMRAALKAAISNEKRAAAAVVRNERAIETSAGIVGDAVQRLERAEGALEKARQADASAVAKAAAGSGKAPASLMSKARATQQAATDALDAAKVARAGLEAKQSDLKSAVRQAHERVEEAVADVLKIEVPIKQIVEKAEQAMTEVTRLRVLLRILAKDNLIADEKLKERAHAVLWLNKLPGEFGHSGDWSGHPATVAYEKMSARLMTDADTTLDIF
jgi:hypothetical protein